MPQGGQDRAPRALGISNSGLGCGVVLQLHIWTNPRAGPAGALRWHRPQVGGPGVGKRDFCLNGITSCSVTFLACALRRENQMNENRGRGSRGPQLATLPSTQLTDPGLPEPAPPHPHLGVRSPCGARDSGQVWGCWQVAGVPASPGYSPLPAPPSVTPGETGVPGEQTQSSVSEGLGRAALGGRPPTLRVAPPRGSRGSRGQGPPPPFSPRLLHSLRGRGALGPPQLSPACPRLEPVPGLAGKAGWGRPRDSGGTECWASPGFRVTVTILKVLVLPWLV